MNEIRNKKVAFHNLGCKVNSYETEAMLRQLEAEGYEIVPFEPGADIYVINTCTVTNIADRKSRQMLHRAKSMNPNAVVAAVGCYVQANSESLQKDEAIDIIVGNDQKHRLAEIIKDYADSKEECMAVIDIGKHKEYEEMEADCSEHTRAFLKIEDGCNQFCSYCLIPYVRGRVRSRAPEAVLAEAERLIEKGFKEIVLTGIHLSSYGLDFEGDAANRGAYGGPLLALIRQLNELPGLERIRLGSLEPRIITQEFAEELKKCGKICPHFHLSLQSGCDETLKRMNRKYTAGEYSDKCRILRDVFDQPALTTDVIAGFPGETEEEFRRTMEFLTELKLYETHVFRYSRRKGTAADAMKEQVPEPVKAQRSEKLLALDCENRRLFEESWIGREAEILLEEEQEQNGELWYTGHTREYIKVKIPAAPGSNGQVIRTVIRKEMLMKNDPS